MRFTILNIIQATIIVALSCALSRWFGRDLLSTYILAISCSGLGIGLWCGLTSRPASPPVGPPSDAQLRSRMLYLGLLIGVAAGVVAGITTDLGLWAIATFNPGLPPQDFRISFGVIVGAILGAFIGVSISGVAGMFRRWRT